MNNLGLFFQHLMSLGLPQSGVDCLVNTLLAFKEIPDISEQTCQHVLNEVQNMNGDDWWEFAKKEIHLSDIHSHNALQMLFMLYSHMVKAKLNDDIQRNCNCYLAAILRMIRLEPTKKSMRLAVC